MSLPQSRLVEKMRDVVIDTERLIQLTKYANYLRFDLKSL